MFINDPVQETMSVIESHNFEDWMNECMMHDPSDKVFVISEIPTVFIKYEQLANEHHKIANANEHKELNEDVDEIEETTAAKKIRSNKRPMPKRKEAIDILTLVPVNIYTLF